MRIKKKVDLRTERFFLELLFFFRLLLLLVSWLDVNGRHFFSDFLTHPWAVAHSKHKLN